MLHSPVPQPWIEISNLVLSELATHRFVWYLLFFFLLIDCWIDHKSIAQNKYNSWWKWMLHNSCLLYSIDWICYKKGSTRFLKGRLVQMRCAHITPDVTTSTAASHAVSMSLTVRIYSSCTPKISMTTLISWMGSFSLTGQSIVVYRPAIGEQFLCICFTFISDSD
jgi:hypothetical protein